jgi:hypothetical protein
MLVYQRVNALIHSPNISNTLAMRWENALQVTFYENGQPLGEPIPLADGT